VRDRGRRAVSATDPSCPRPGSASVPGSVRAEKHRRCSGSGARGCRAAAGRRCRSRADAMHCFGMSSTPRHGRAPMPEMHCFGMSSMPGRRPMGQVHHHDEFGRRVALDRWSSFIARPDPRIRGGFGPKRWPCGIGAGIRGGFGPKRWPCGIGAGIRGGFGPKTMALWHRGAGIRTFRSGNDAFRPSPGPRAGRQTVSSTQPRRSPGRRGASASPGAADGAGRSGSPPEANGGRRR
jgi:hypothetical protein